MVDLRSVKLPMRGGKAPPSSAHKRQASPAKSIVIKEQPFVDEDGIEWWPETSNNTKKHPTASIAPPPLKTRPAARPLTGTPPKPAGNPSQKATAAKTAAGDTRECLICVEEVELRNVMKTSCNHYWCRRCLTDRFQVATKDETQNPPKCCDEILLTEARLFLDPNVASDFQKKRVEFETTAKDRVYCYKNECGKFIHADHIRHNIATCSSCSRQTCTKCKAKHHSGKCEDAALELAKKGLEAIGGKMCPKCGQGVERFDGCNHFTCVCGHQFCFLCLRHWKHFRCSCPSFSNIEAEKEGAVYKTVVPGAPDRPKINNDPMKRYGREIPLAMRIQGNLYNRRDPVNDQNARREFLERLRRGDRDGLLPVIRPQVASPENDSTANAGAWRIAFSPELGLPRTGPLPRRPHPMMSQLLQTPALAIGRNNPRRNRIPEACNHQMERAGLPLYCYFCNRDAEYRCLICRSWFCLECPESVGISSRGII